VQCAKRFCTITECGGTHIELTANVRDVVRINIENILPNIEVEKHCITKIEREIDATVIAAVPTSFEEVSDGLKSDHSTKSCSEPLCIAIDNETVTNIIEFSTRFLTQQTLHGTRLQGDTIVVGKSDVLNMRILIATTALVGTSDI
jgi:hypothetical protein